MKALILIVPMVSAAVFFGADTIMSSEPKRSDENIADAVAAASNAETQRTRNFAEESDSAQNSIVAWIISAFSSDEQPAASKPDLTQKSAKKSSSEYGFKFGKCQKVGQGKRCSVQN